MLPDRNIKKKNIDEGFYVHHSGKSRMICVNYLIMCFVLILFLLQVCSFYFIFTEMKKINEINRNQETVSKMITFLWNKRHKRTVDFQIELPSGYFDENDVRLIYDVSGAFHVSR